MPFKPVLTDKAPLPAGPYSQALRVGPWLFCSGQIPLNLSGSQIVGSDIEAQSRQVFKNIKAVLAEEDMTFKNVVKSMVFLTNMEEFSKFNKIYESYFIGHRPARSCVEVSALPKSAKVEMEVTAFKPAGSFEAG